MFRVLLMKIKRPYKSGYVSKIPLKASGAPPNIQIGRTSQWIYDLTGCRLICDSLQACPLYIVFLTLATPVQRTLTLSCFSAIKKAYRKTIVLRYAKLGNGYRKVSCADS